MSLSDKGSTMKKAFVITATLAAVLSLAACSKPAEQAASAADMAASAAEATATVAEEAASAVGEAASAVVSQ